MKHIHIDEFAKLNSPLHRMDPRAKAISVLFFIVVTVVMQNPLSLAMAIIFWGAALLVSRIPLGFVFRRIMWIIPFAGVLIIFFPFTTPGEVIWSGGFGFIKLEATRQGIDKAVMLFLRVLASMLPLITLISTTKFNDLMKALSDLKVPLVILNMVEFTIRYLYVTVDEQKRMRRARKSRAFEAAGSMLHGHTIKTLAQMVGLMFIRAYERGDRVYIAMLSRGFSGKILTLSDYTISFKDYLGAAFITVIAISLFIIDKGGF